jgi:hypothetical protein
MKYIPTQPDAINTVECNLQTIASAGEIQVAMDGPDLPGKERLYLIAETKGAADPSRLQYATEAPKIHCGQQHFKQLEVPYCLCKSAADLPSTHLPTPKEPQP